MPTHFIEPSALDADAVVPQACDNQFVNDALFKDIISRNSDFQDAAIRDAKRRAVHGELVRSLVYGSQTVINRAYLHNNYGIYHNYEDREGNRDNAQAFAQLLRERAIVPFLYKEKELSLDQIEAEQDFTKDEAGVAALRYLLDLTGDVTATGFPDGHPNLTLIGKKFRDYVCSLKRLEDDSVRVMCHELFPGVPEQNVFGAYTNAVKEFGRWADAHYDKHGKLSREIIYDSHFVEPKSNVAHGRFRKRGEPRMQLALKKLVDLKYNSNMPDAISRYTFTPHAMPTRSALADEFQIGRFKSRDVEHLISSKLTSEFARQFHAATSKAMYLPFLGELTMRDVAAIRQLPTRSAFIAAQRAILENPLAVAEKLPEYQTAFEGFQRDLSRWYTTTYKRDPLQRRLESFATVGIRFGGHVLIYGLTQGLSAGCLGTAMAHTTWESTQEKVKGLAVKLMLKVYDHVHQWFDPNLSFSIDVLRSEATYKADEIRNLVENIERQSMLAKPLVMTAEADSGG